MQKLPIRMILTVLFLGGSYVDLMSISGSTTLDEFQALANEAQQRYQARVDQSTPECLEDMQSIAEAYFYYDWKSYEAAGQGNYNQATLYEDEMFKGFGQMQQEFNRLALEYEWDVE